MALNYSYYQVSIASMTGTAPADGFIDNKTPEQYGAASAFPSTYANSTAKVRANMRYKAVVQQINNMASGVIDPTKNTATGADANTAPNPFVFVVFFDRDDNVFTNDELNSGTVLSGAAAVKRCVARAFVNSFTANAIVYDPTTSGSPAAVRVGNHTVSLTAGAPAADIATAEGNITVTKIASGATLATNI